MGEEILTGAEQKDVSERISAWVARQVVGHRVIVLLFMIGATIFWLYHCVNVKVFTHFPDLLPEHPYIDLVKKYSGFGATNQVLIEIRAKNGTIFNKETLKKIIDTSEDCVFIEGIDRNKIYSIGVAKCKNFKITAWGMEFPSLMYPEPPETEEDMEYLKSNIYSNTLYYGRYVSLDSSSALINTEYFEEGVNYRQVYEKLEGIKKKYSDENHEVYVVGGPYLYGVVAHYIKQTVMVFVVTGIVMILIAALYTRHWRLTVLPLAAAVVAAIWGIGFIGLTGNNLDPLILVVPLLISARALSHSIQHNWRINEEYYLCKDMPLACERTISALFYPGLSGIVTDAMGILLIAFVPIPLMYKLGVICFCWAMSMIFVVLIQDTIFYLYLPKMKNIDDWYNKKREGSVDRVMGFIARAGEGAGKYLILAIVLMAAIVSAYFSFRLQVGDVFPGTPILREESPYNQACKVLARDFPGSMDPFLIIARCDGERGIVKAKLMDTIADFQFYLMENPLIKATISISDLIKNLYTKYMQNDPKHYILPADDPGVGAMLFLLMSGGAEPGDFDQYYTPDNDAANIVAYCQDHTTQTVNQVLSYCKDFISRIEDPDIHFDLASGSVGVVAATNDAVAKDQIALTIAAFVSVFFFCSLFFQSFVAAFLLMLPLGVANLFVFGYMGFAGIGLNLQTLPVSTIAVGIGVDYGIYLLSRIKEETIRLGDLEKGISEAVRTCGNAVTITALIIIAGVAFWFISDIKFQSDMGLLLSLVTFFHLLGTLFFLPTLVFIVKPKYIMNRLAK